VPEINSDILNTVFSLRGTTPWIGDRPAAVLALQDMAGQHKTFPSAIRTKDSSVRTIKHMTGGGGGSATEV
jgi:hypothetical protein